MADLATARQEALDLLAMHGQQPPPWFDAALDPQARVGRLLAAGLLLPEVQAAAGLRWPVSTGAMVLAWVVERLPGLPDGPGGVLPGDDAPTSRWQVVDASALNVRAGPGTAEPVLDSLPRGAVAEGTGRTETVDGVVWVELRLPDGGTGWASGGFLTELDG